MENEISTKPLVDVLSKQLGKAIVMRGLEYVDMPTLTPVSQSDIDIALAEQQRLLDVDILALQQDGFNDAIQGHLDSQAKSLRYDNINAIGKYVGYANDFQVEAELLGAWASSCWKVAATIETDVQSGTRVMPTVDEVIAELPLFAG